MNNRADLSLETVGKALLVLAVVIVLIIIFRSLIGSGNEDIANVQGNVSDQANDCIGDIENCDPFGGDGSNRQDSTNSGGG